MNAVARPQLKFQILTLLQKYLYRQSLYSKTWDSWFLALIAQMVRAFGMNPKVGGSIPPQVEFNPYPRPFCSSLRTPAPFFPYFF